MMLKTSATPPAKTNKRMMWSPDGQEMTQPVVPGFQDPFPVSPSQVIKPGLGAMLVSTHHPSTIQPQPATGLVYQHASWDVCLANAPITHNEPY